jgi:hypothetical protein
MALNPLYVAGMSLQEYLVDKDSGEPLAGGMIFFKAINNQGNYKSVYELVGGQFLPLPNPVILSGVGTVQDDNGNDIVIYYYPYDADGNVELYYVEVQSSGGVPQFTRDNWPPNSFNSGGGGSGSSAINYVPNPQFLTHNNLTPTTQVQPGTTEIASGGWEFVLSPNDSTSINTISFPVNNSYVASPPQSPLYNLNIISVTPSTGDSLKALRLKFDDANKFSSNSQIYTYGFFAKTTGSAINVTLVLRKYFGAGGSTFIPVNLTTFSIDSTDFQLFQFSFVFGENSGFTFGTGESYVALDIQFNVADAFNLTFNDFMLLTGDLQLDIDSLPVQTDADTLTRSIAGWMDNPGFNGEDLYLPLVRTPYGLTWDNSQIGLVYASLKGTLSPGELLCDGTTYFNNQYSSDGIPYSRLGAVLWNNASYSEVPLFGTGSDFVTAFSVGNGVFYLAANKAGTATPPINGTLSTTFTIETDCPGVATAPAVYAGDWTASGAANAFFRYNDIGTASLTTSNGTAVAVFPIQNNTLTHYQANITVGLASSFVAGNTLTITDSSSVSTIIYFRKNGSSVSAGNINVNVVNADTPFTIAAKILFSINGGWTSSISTVAASSIPNLSYFTFTANSIAYNVTYYNGVSIPEVLASNIIPVALTGSENAQDVATKTILAINQFAYAVPDLQGQFLRGTDPTTIWDTNSPIRSGFGQNYVNNGPGPGTYEVDTFASHVHSETVTTGSPFGALSGPQSSTLATGFAITDLTTANTGFEETRGMNISVNWVIKY